MPHPRLTHSLWLIGAFHGAINLEDGSKCLSDMLISFYKHRVETFLDRSASTVAPSLEAPVMIRCGRLRGFIDGSHMYTGLAGRKTLDSAVLEAQQQHPVYKQ